MRFDVYGIGNAVVDLQIKAAEGDLLAFGLEKGAMTLVDSAAQGALLEHFNNVDVHQASGGSAANTIIALAELGAAAGYGCLLGDDQRGEFYRDEMSALNVRLDSRVVGGESTGTCVILITEDAERTMNTNLGASALFGPEHVSEESLKNSSWLYIEGYLFSSDLGQQAVAKALEIAKRFQIKVALTFSATFIVDAFREPLTKAVEQADLLFANSDEAAVFTGESGDEEVFAAFKQAAPNVVMTQGDKGVRVSWEGEEFFTPALKIKAVDSTGAGDMFAGGFLYGITAGLEAKKTAELACALSAEVVSRMGPRLTGRIKQVLEQTVGAK